MTVRRLRTTALLILALVPAILLGVAQPANAHANLVKSDPAEGTVLRSAPGQVVFTFDEAVRGVPDGVRVFGAQGDLVAATPAVTGAELAVGLPEGLGNGTTVITWRVVSDDGHPISGSLTFSVGAPSSAVTPPAAAGTPEVPGTLTVARGVGYGGLFLAAGLVMFTAMVLPAGSARRRLTLVTRAAAAVTAVAWLAAVPITAIYLLGGGPSLLTRSSTWSSLPLTEYAVAATVVLGSTLAVVSQRHRVVAVAAASVAVMAPALVGHTRAAGPEALAVAADALHLLAGSVWLGGLAGLALTLPVLSGRAAAETLTRFSTAAAGVLAALVATGSLLTWRILGSWSALFDTDYGRLLQVKIGVVLTAVAIAAWNRWSLLPRLKQAPERLGKPVARAVTVEGALLVAVLLVTGFLVDTSPEAGARPASATARADTQTTTLGDINVRAKLAPLARGTTTMTLQLTSATGEPAEGVAPPVVRLSSDQATLGDIPLTQVAPGFYTAQVTLPVPGTWRMQMSLRVSQFTNPVGELEFVVS